MLLIYPFPQKIYTQPFNSNHFIYYSIITAYYLVVFHAHFLPLQYAVWRTGINLPKISTFHLLMEHVEYPLSCLIVQPLNLLLAIGILLLCIYKKWLQKGVDVDNKLKNLIVYFSIAPLLLTCLISMLAGIKILAEWGFPLLSLTFLGIFYYSQLTTQSLKKIVAVILVVQVLVFSAYLLSTILPNKINGDNNPSYTLAKAAESYLEQMGYTLNTIQFIGGAEKRAEYYLAAYLPSKPALLARNSLDFSPWINKSEFLKSRGIIIAKGCDQSSRSDLQQKFNIIDDRCISIPAEDKLHSIGIFFTLYIVFPKASAF